MGGVAFHNPFRVDCFGRNRKPRVAGLFSEKPFGLIIVQTRILRGSRSTAFSIGFVCFAIGTWHYLRRVEP
jgi:hypothetical protein